MRPIRKQELDYLHNLINDKFRDKQRVVQSQCEVEINKQLDKDFDKFISSLKIDNLLKDAEKAEKEYFEFRRNKDAKEVELRDLANKKKNILQEKIISWSKVRDWNISVNNKPDNFDEILSELRTVCKKELQEKYKNSEKGKFLRYLENGIEDAKNVLYSGLSIEDVWQNIDSIFSQAQIEVRIPKAMSNNLLAK